MTCKLTCKASYGFRIIAIQLTFEKYYYDGCPQGEFFLEIISQDRNSEETIYIHVLASINVLHTYGVAMISRMLKNIGLFCKRAL